MRYNPQAYFYYKDKLYSLYSYIQIEGKLIQHSLGEIPHTVEVLNDRISVLANSDKMYVEFKPTNDES
mgnify:CR=1 FL=1